MMDFELTGKQECQQGETGAEISSPLCWLEMMPPLPRHEPASYKYLFLGSQSGLIYIV